MIHYICFIIIIKKKKNLSIKLDNEIRVKYTILFYGRLIDRYTNYHDPHPSPPQSYLQENYDNFDSGRRRTFEIKLDEIITSCRIS